MTTKGQFIEKAAASATSFGVDAIGANPPTGPETPEEESAWQQASPWVHGILGVASFIPGLSIVTGAADAAIYAAEGNYVEAGLSVASMVPGGKVVTTAGKVAKRAVGLAQNAGTVAKVTKGVHETREMAKAASRLQKSAPLRKTESAVDSRRAAGKATPGKAKKNTTVKGRKKLKCGEQGSYADLKTKMGGGKFHRDHIPSKEALKQRAKKLRNNVPLTAAQKRAIEEWGKSIAVPRQAHIDISPTYGTKNIKLAPLDAADLAGAAQRDVDAMLKEIDEYDADGGCKKAYKKAAKRILEMSNDDFDEALRKILNTVK